MQKKKRLGRWLSILFIAFLPAVALTMNFGRQPLPEPPSLEHATLRPTPPMPVRGNLEKYHSRVTGLQFFFAGGNGEVKYRTVFSQEQASQMGWEICLENTEPNRQVEIRLLHTLRDPNNQIAFEHESLDVLAVDMPKLCFRKNLSWDALPGIYRLQVLNDGAPIATGAFEISEAE
jgi:hypothetical protein